MKKDKILVVGGYGDVGRRICLGLSEHYPDQVIAAGRSLEKARQFAASTGGKVLARQIDIAGVVPNEELQDILLVIMVVDMPDAKFVHQCFEQCVHYIDITATYKLIEQIKDLNEMAIRHGATGIVSVGLDPGLSNLLAKHCVSYMEKVDHIDIHLLLGLGDNHGEASINWILDTIQRDYAILLNGRLTKVNSFRDGKQTQFPGGLGKHTTYSFNFSDQHVLPETLGASGVRTRICFENRRITALFALLARIGFFKLLKYKPVRSIYKHLLNAFKYGSDVYAVKVKAYGYEYDTMVQMEASLIGHREANGTAMATVKTACLLLDNEIESGVFHSEELFDLGDYVDDLEGVDFYLDNRLPVAT
ncbi:saccharopine dehydrogenase NADP-binding domain-containing protein [Ekhidna sp.]|uniref:saccharopine dehydrogenase family protein n=1 Tax=Ekhidna sp. TaxID=2608089 RepID=UPI0032985B9C